jgi:tetratricopeptide (TPR) repeat protein
MDSEDALMVARMSAFDRVKNGFFPDALAAGKGALKIAQDRYGPVHPALIPFLVDLASIERQMALYPDAESNLLWGLALARKNFGLEDGRVADCLVSLASLYIETGRWKDAEFYAGKALAIREKQALRIPLAQALRLSGETQWGLGRGDQAASLLRRSLDLLEESPASPPAERISTLNLLARAYRTEKSPARAADCLQDALQLARKDFEPDSVEVADALEALGDEYRAEGKTTMARRLYGEAFPLYQRFVGVYYGYSTLPYLRKLALSYEALGKYKEAEDLLQKSLQTLKETYGSSHPRLAETLFLLARVEGESGENALSQGHLREALKMARSFLTDSHPLVRQILALLDR